MPIQTAEAVVTFAGLYLGLGAAFAALFILFGLSRSDPAARGAGLGYRLLIFPGLAALWPAALVWWLRSFTGARP